MHLISSLFLFLFICVQKYNFSLNYANNLIYFFTQGAQVMHKSCTL